MTGDRPIAGPLSADGSIQTCIHTSMNQTGFETVISRVIVIGHVSEFCSKWHL